VRHADPQVPLRSAGTSKFAVVVSRFNDAITSRLLEGARAALREAGAQPDHVVAMSVPGAFELPQAARCAAESGSYDAIICLGCVIRGETAHFEYISAAAAHGLMQASGETGVPMAFGVLTTNSVEEALARAGDGPGNKGHEAALAAIEMAEVVAQLTRQATPRT
jgi:6,7-dimethyl-8-ribityllumazine synthase